MQELPSDKRVKLTVRAHDRLSEVFLVDNRFQLVTHDIGQLEALVNPGIYKARFRVGQQQVDQMIEVLPGAGFLELDGNPVDFISPIPFVGTSSYREVHRGAAEELSRSVSEKKGEGAWIFLFLRDITRVGSSCWSGVSLHDLEGTLIAEPSEGVCDQENGFFALHIEVSPGTYRLRVEEEPGESYEIFIKAVAGWQTQIFALSEAAWLPEVEAYRAALPSASVLMVEVGQGFNAEDVVTRQVDLLRLGLLHGRQVVTDPVVSSLLKEEILNPMQVILAAHSLLRQGKLENSQLTSLRKKLPADFSEHPDIQSLVLHQPTDTRLAFSAPPMLRSSWDRIVQAMEERKAIIPPGSLAAEITGGVINTALWLVHRLDSLEG